MKVLVEFAYSLLYPQLIHDLVEAWTSSLAVRNHWLSILRDPLSSISFSTWRTTSWLREKSSLLLTITCMLLFLFYFQIFIFLCFRRSGILVLINDCDWEVFEQENTQLKVFFLILFRIRQNRMVILFSSYLRFTAVKLCFNERNKFSLKFL